MYITLYAGLTLIGIITMLYSFMGSDDILKIVTSSVSAIIFILSGISIFTNGVIIYSGDYTYITSSEWIGTLFIIIGAIMTLYIITIIYNIFISEKNLNYIGHG